ncbi:DUF4294 domain-containing protein [Chryseobacterium chendengshani]|uniref:DUF4294 domain-containing protein n=1 Tax=unclassified Chryseobacterium TaxID=2593645 RepID=UPI001C641315|nr:MULTISPECIES: DUF4294 domain-containing protein [unclassified Chryseobacterium]MBW7674362.1 DUF4294 domain-containing protein [Chryseobacterium sp. LJ756]MBW8522850.1 DUF4294 domain-containing protein [Chryseobacterium sp. LJ668]QYK16381.1 DUF4294 domain-containing protein [Chryseobacterium sp. LJ668]
MKFHKVTFLFLFFFGVAVFGQQRDSVIIAKPLSQYPQDQLKTDEFGNKYYYDERQKAKIYEINGETVVVMDELVLLNKPRFNNQLDKNYYFFLNKKLYRVYPLFLTALQQYRDIQKEMMVMDTAAKRKYIKDRQNMLADQYEKQLRDLTTTEGQVFAKLMNRATGKNVFEIIKEMRGGWSAFWWNVKGKMADIDLKDKYNPHKNRTDEFLESLLQSNWNSGYLQPYPGAKDFKVSN